MLIDGFTLFGNWPGLPFDHQVDQLINGLERTKMDRACTLSSKSIFFDAAIGNDATWEACQRDPRLVPIGVADPRLNGVEQVEYCLQKGFRLMALFPAAQGWSLNSLTARLVLREIAEARLPVLIEAGREGDASAIEEAARGLNIQIVLLDVSLRTLTEAVTVLKAHAGSRYLEAFKVPIGELVPTLRGGIEFYLATRLLCGGDTIEFLAKTVGADRLVFTSRFPISCFSSAFLTANYASISDEDRNAIMGGNMVRLLE